MNSLRASFVAAFAVAALPVCAAPAAAPGFTLFDTVTAAFSATAENDLRRGAGKLSVQHFEFEAGGRSVLAGGAAVSHGLGFARTELDRSAASLLPETLQELSLRLGWTYQRGPQWRFLTSLRPGFYGDGGAVDSDTFNAPFLGLASYAASRELVWSFGVVANAFSDNPVLPVAGVRWAWAPAWVFNLGLPRTGVSWEMSPTATLHAGATVQGGAYRLTRNPAGAAPGAAALAGEKLDYREIRVGVGGTFKLSATMTLSVDAGIAVDQRFDYHERGIEQRGESAAFGAVSLSGRF